MKAVGAYFVAVASAVALTVFSLITPGLWSFETEADHGSLQRAGDLMQIVWLSYATIFAIAIFSAAVPFALVLKASKIFFSSFVAAAIAGCLAAAAVLFVIDLPGWTLSSEVRSLPGTLISGLFGGIVYAIATQEKAPSGS